YLVDHARPYGFSPDALRLRYLRETEVSVRRALLIALGDYDRERIGPIFQKVLVEQLLKEFVDDPDPGIHGAIEWTLRQWKQEDKLPKLKGHKPKDAPKGTPTWYVNGQGQTFTVIRGPVEFLMGSPESETGRSAGEKLHRRRIPRSFAIGTKEVTVAEFQRFLQAKPQVQQHIAPDLLQELKKFSPADDGPMIMVNWHYAAVYCNWLSEREGL